MNIDIYATTTSTSFIAVCSGSSVPQGLPATRLFKSIELDPAKPRIALDQAQAIADIEAQGWAVLNVRWETKVVT